MKALVCRKIADDLGTLRIENVALPSVGPLEARVRVRAASVNFPDILMVQGRYQHKPELPFTPGTEAVGEIIEVGSSVTDFRIGDRVIVGGMGCFAEEVQLASTRLRPVPSGVDDATAAGFTAAYLTAYVALVRRANIDRSQWLLVHGAAGGVGLAAVDLGLAMGANVIATASTTQKRDFLVEYGLKHVLLSSGFRDSVKALTAGRGADVIFDPVGGDSFDESTRCIAFDGSLLVIGFAGGRIAQIGTNIPLIKGFSVVGVRAGEYGRRFPDKGRENIAAIDRMLAEGRLHPHVGARFPLERAVEAMRMLQQRKAIGKVIVTSQDIAAGG